MTEILSIIDPKLYRPHITIEKGRTIIYAKLRKVLYVMLQAPLKFRDQVLNDLIGQGYTINQYDWCVANKMVSRKQ